jgi:hypothetical protein
MQQKYYEFFGAQQHQSSVEMVDDITNINGLGNQLEQNMNQWLGVDLQPHQSSLQQRLAAT